MGKDVRNTSTGIWLPRQGDHTGKEAVEYLWRGGKKSWDVGRRNQSVEFAISLGMDTLKGRSLVNDLRGEKFVGGRGGKDPEWEEP